MYRDGRKLYQVMKSMPMGWSHSLYVALNVHLRILENAGLPMNSWVTNSIVISEFNFGAYVDDYFSLGTNAELARRHLAAVIRESAHCALSCKPQKVS